MRKLILMITLIAFIALVPGDADGRSIKAYFNGREATVSGVVLRQGEPFTIDLYVTPDEGSYAFAVLDEPGVDRAYDWLGGDEIVPSAGRPCNASCPARYRWVMAANGRWAGGTAPLNIYYQINARGSPDPSASGLFTVVDAYVAPGRPYGAESGPNIASPNIASPNIASPNIASPNIASPNIASPKEPIARSPAPGLAALLGCAALAAAVRKGIRWGPGPSRKVYNYIKVI